MKALLAFAVVGLTVVGHVGMVSAQPYGGRDYEYRDRDYGGGRYRDRDDDVPRGRSYGGGDRGGYGGRGQPGDYAFDEQEYLRCNPDVRRAIINGQMKSGLAHYRTFGRRENRRLSC